MFMKESVKKNWVATKNAEMEKNPFIFSLFSSISLFSFNGIINNNELASRSSTREKKHAFLKMCNLKKMHVFFSRVDEALGLCTSFKTVKC